MFPISRDPKTCFGQLSQQVQVPTENLVSPDLVRRMCWDWKDVDDDVGAVEAFLRNGGARPWQRELVVPVLAAALSPAAELSRPAVTPSGTMGEAAVQHRHVDGCRGDVVRSDNESIAPQHNEIGEQAGLLRGLVRSRTDRVRRNRDGDTGLV